MTRPTRREALELILGRLHDRDIALFTTGFISREAFGLKDRPRNFYMIGSMGLLSSLGLGLALQRPDLRVLTIEGDGSALMSLGTLSLIGQTLPRNFVHIVLDNEAYESTGGQPTITQGLNLAQVARSCGYVRSTMASDSAGFSAALDEAFEGPWPAFLLAKVQLSPTREAPRVAIEPPELCLRFRAALQAT